MKYEIKNNGLTSSVMIKNGNTSISVSIGINFHIVITDDKDKIIIRDITFNKDIIGYSRMIEAFLNEVNRFYTSDMKSDLELILMFLAQSISA